MWKINYCVLENEKDVPTGERGEGVSEFERWARVRFWASSLQGNRGTPSPEFRNTFIVPFFKITVDIVWFCRVYILSSATVS